MGAALNSDQTQAQVIEDLSGIDENLRQMIYALERAREANKAEASRRLDARDYNAEFFGEDAESLDEAIKLIALIGRIAGGATTIPIQLPGPSYATGSGDAYTEFWDEHEMLGMYRLGRLHAAAKIGRLSAVEARCVELEQDATILRTLLKEGRMDLSLAASSWNEAADQEVATFHTERVLALIKRVDAALANQPEAVLQGSKPVCVECSDEITAHDPGVCGTCYATKYEDAPQAAQGSGK